MRTVAILGVGIVVGSVAGSYATLVALYHAVGDELPKVVDRGIAERIINQRDRAIERYLGASPNPQYVYSCKHDPSS